MTFRTMLRVTLIGLATLAVAPGAPAQQTQDGEKRSFTRMLNVDALLDNYARFLARKYNLDESQDEFTQKLLRDRTTQFLDQHREQLFGLVDRLFEVRAGAEMGPDELLDWGKQIAPIFEEAKSIIIDGNMQWRDILNEDQKKIHDEDLKLMEESFATTEDQLTRITNGEMSVEEFRQGNRKPPKNANPKHTPPPGTGSSPQRPPGAAPRSPATTDGGTANSPGTHEGGATTGSKRPGPANRVSPPGGHTAPPRSNGTPPPPSSGAGEAGATPPPPESGQPGTPPGIAGAGGHAPQPSPDPKGNPKVASSGKTPSVKDPESEWEKYVKEFIQKYHLDEDQTAKAHSILKESQDQAARVIDGKKSEMAALDKEINKLSGNKEKDKEKAAERVKALSDLKKKRDALAEPIGKIFEKMKARLMKIPTRAQIKAAEAALKKGGKDSKSAGTGSGLSSKKSDADGKSGAKSDSKGEQPNSGLKPGGKPAKPENPPPPQEEPPQQNPPNEEQPQDEGQPEEHPAEGNP